MPNEDRIVYAKWEAADMTYNVVDYVEGTDGVYTAASSKQETAKTDTEVSPKPDIRNLDSRINMTRLVPQLRVLHKSQPA